MEVLKKRRIKREGETTVNGGTWICSEARCMHLNRSGGCFTAKDGGGLTTKDGGRWTLRQI
ncbi:hypothetical protein SESBI_22532 [Sesbania bispinosa]|nr:hypothetical protein SESBI_22532 [Sesbania bispinosa]